MAEPPIGGRAHRPDTMNLIHTEWNSARRCLTLCMNKWAIIGALALACAPAASCGRSVNPAAGLTIEAVSTGWRDVGLVDGKNKLVPSVSFTLKNVSDRPLSSLQVNAVFRRAGEDREWGSAFVTAAGTPGLAPGRRTGISVKSQLGYTGTDSRAEMLRNSRFVDAKVDVFAKYGSTSWARLGEFPIDRRLIADQP